MKKEKMHKILFLTLILGVFMSGTMLNASSITKTLKAVYNNIGVSYNGQIKSLSSEPFVVNGTTYVPLRVIGEIMGATVTWANNTVSIQNQNTASASSEQEIASKNFEIASLKQQLEVTNNALKTYTETNTALAASNLTTAAVNNTLSQIESDYSDDYDIDWDFDLSIASSRLQLTVSYDSNYDDDDFDAMTESERKAFIKEICYDISDNHKNVEIIGTLEDSREDTEIADFTYTTSGSFTYDEEDTYSLSDFEYELEDDYANINCIGFSIPIESITLDEDDDELLVTITTDLTPDIYDYRSSWNALTSDNENDLEYFLDDITADIEDEYSSYDEIDFIIKDTSLGTIVSYEDEYLDVYNVAADAE